MRVYVIYILDSGKIPDHDMLLTALGDLMVSQHGTVDKGGDDVASVIVAQDNAQLDELSMDDLATVMMHGSAYVMIPGLATEEGDDDGGLDERNGEDRPADEGSAGSPGSAA